MIRRTSVNAAPSSLPQVIERAAKSASPPSDAQATIARTGTRARGRIPSARPTITAHQTTAVKNATRISSEPPSAIERPK